MSAPRLLSRDEFLAKPEGQETLVIALLLYKDFRVKVAGADPIDAMKEFVAVTDIFGIPEAVRSEIGRAHV